MLRNRIYTGDFDWDGKMYKGVHEPLVSRELWDKVQDTLDRRFAHRHRVVKHDFPFSGLLRCGHCGCALVGELKKKRYIYYHCTGQKGSCGERYVRQELLEQMLADMLRAISIPVEVVELARDAFSNCRSDDKVFHAEAISRLHAEHDRLQSRIDAMYVDKLDRKISGTFFEEKTAEWRDEQNRLAACIEDHQAADTDYLEQGIDLLELVSTAHQLFEMQPAHEKRRLLRFVLSNCTWKAGELQPTFRQPFDLVADTVAGMKKPPMSAGLENDQTKKWLLR